MIEEILEGISTRLHELYPDYHKYIKVLEQNFETPCFLIQHRSISRVEPQLWFMKAHFQEGFQIAVISDYTVEISKVTQQIAFELLRPIETENYGSFLARNIDYSVTESEGTINFDFIISVESDEPKEPIMNNFKMERNNG